MLNRFAVSATIVSGIFLISFLANSHALAEDRITHEYKVTPATKITDKERQALSLAASELLRHVNEARVDIKYAGGKNAAARVEKAISLVRIMENALPEYQVSTIIKSGNLTYKDEEKRKQFLVPVYGELDEVFAIEASVKRAGRETAGKEGLELSDEVESRYTKTFLDVRDAKHYLEQADAALNKNDAAAADAALAAIQAHVITQYHEIDLPLITVRRSLVEAARAAAAQKYNEAKQALQKAADVLEEYRSKTGQEVSNRARALAEEIKSLANTLDQKKEGAVDAITNLWERAANLF